MEIFMAYIWHAKPLQQSLHLFPPDYQIFSGLQGGVNWTYLIKKKQHCNLIVSKILLIKSPSEKDMTYF